MLGIAQRYDHGHSGFSDTWHLLAVFLLVMAVGKRNNDYKPSLNEMGR
jgi:hypothetical protein